MSPQVTPPTCRASRWHPIKKTWRITETQGLTEGGTILRQSKPLVKVRLAPSLLDLPSSGEAIIDTGADLSAIDKTIVEPWGLSYVDRVKVNTPDGPGVKLRPIYEVVLHIDELGFSKKIRMVEADLLGAQRIVALIGTDLMRGGLLRYDARDKGRFSLSFDDSKTKLPSA